MTALPVPGLNFVLSDGSLDRPKMEVVARTRSVIFAACYPSDERAFAGELERIETDAHGEWQVWAAQNGIDLVEVVFGPGEMADTFESWGEKQPWHPRNRAA